MKDHGRVLLVSCYELGHQPLAVASPSALLEKLGYRPAVLDLSVERPDDDAISRARFVGISVPMHTALHVGVRFARRVRTSNPAAHVCFYGLYALLNSRFLLDGLADSVVGGEFETPLADVVQRVERGERIPDHLSRPHLERVPFVPPSRDALPPLERYAKLEDGRGERAAAAVEASRGCLHRCLHCPITPIYDGRFFVVPQEVVLEDIRRVRASGARHITFADPDFLNGPGHSLAIVRRMREELPDLTFDCTTKIEHILEHRDVFAELAACGCLFVVSAVESLSDTVLLNLAKGHTRRDVFEAADVLREVGIALRPSLLPFTPWTRAADYRELLEWIGTQDLVGHIDPVQLSIRLLVPPGSPLASSPAMVPHLTRPAPERFCIEWRHPDPSMDRLWAEVATIVTEDAVAGRPAETTFESVRLRAESTLGGPIVPRKPRAMTGRPPRLTEPWFC